jgi:hypothetical protein
MSTSPAEATKVMKVPGLRSAHEEVGGIVYFGRMLDKIRLKARRELPSDYNTGTKDCTILTLVARGS